MIIDRLKTVNENFQALVKAANPLADLTDLNSVLGTPTVGSFAGGNNTQVLIASIKNKGYSGERSVFYKRCKLTEGLVNPPAFLTPNVGETLAQYSGRVFAQYNLLPSQVTINNGNGFNLTQANVVRSIANSLVYLPGEELNIGVSGGATSASFEFTIGSYTALPYKSSVRETRYGVGKVGQIQLVELDTGHSPAAGTNFGSMQKNPNDVLVGVLGYNSADAATLSTFNLRLTSAFGLTLPDPVSCRIVNLVTGNELLAPMARLAANDAAFSILYPNPPLPSNALVQLGFSTVGAKIGIDLNF